MKTEVQEDGKKDKQTGLLYVCVHVSMCHVSMCACVPVCVCACAYV